MPASAPVVFISYSHDSEEHRETVLRLSERLRADGFDARVDRYVNGTPKQGWPRWMLDQLDAADFVLVVCTEACYRRFRGHEEPGRGKGADWEGALITQQIYDDGSRTVKFAPVMLTSGQEAFIPEPLRGHTHYGLTSPEGYQDLRVFLAGAAGVEPGDLGDLLTFDPGTKQRVASTRLRESADRLFGRETELASLEKAWADPKVHLVTLVAWGGVGKTSLVTKWVANLSARDYDGADYFDWSFYSQGSTEKSGASADPGLTNRLAGLDEPQWNLAISRLAECGLAVRDSGALDAHPLICEHFGRRLRERSLAAWQAAHGRLFEHLTQSTEYRPDTLEGLRPLYQAIAHGCQAGRQQEACDKVYFDRILPLRALDPPGPRDRGTGRAGFYSSRKLGAFGADLGAVACFFVSPWSRVEPALAEADQAWLLGVAAFSLRALGRLTEAVEPMRAALEMVVDKRDWANAARYASNLSELELTLGDVAGAVRDAEQSVVNADRSGERFQRMSKRTTLADALYQAGSREEALARFREAEAMQAEQQPQYPLLYSLQGFQYCDLLLDGADRAAGGGPEDRGAGEACDEVERRALKMFEWRIPDDPLLDIALDHLTPGRARLNRAILKGSAPDVAESEIDQAVDGLRRAGTSHHVPRGLLARPWLRAVQSRPDEVRADLAEAGEIAQRGPMPLHLADVHLYRARLFHDRAALAEAKRLVEKHGYFRRREELADLEAAASRW